MDFSSRREWSKKSALSPAQTQRRQDAIFHGQGRSPFDARSVLPVRERERREEWQVCEPEGQAKGRERRWRLFSTFPMCVSLNIRTYPQPGRYRLVNVGEFYLRGLISFRPDNVISALAGLFNQDPHFGM